jgi:CelD/BcsL family acetyltransferase involved in cellulose biosynthesis
MACRVMAYSSGSNDHGLGDRAMVMPRGHAPGGPMLLERVRVPLGRVVSLQRGLVHGVSLSFPQARAELRHRLLPARRMAAVNSTVVGPVSVVAQGRERRLVSEVDASGAVLSVSVLGPSRAPEREPDRWLLNPPIGLPRRPSVLVVGVADFVSTAVRALEMAAAVVVIDRDPTMVEICQRFMGLESCDRLAVVSEQIEPALDALSERDERFDLVVASAPEPLDPSPIRSLDRLIRLLSPAGTLGLYRRQPDREPPVAMDECVLAHLRDSFARVDLFELEGPPSSTVVTAGVCRNARTSHSARARRLETSPCGAPKGRSLSIDVVTDLVTLQTMADEWAQSLEASLHPVSHEGPAWVLPWYRCYLGAHEPYVIVVRSGGRVAGVVPLVRARAPRGFDLIWSAGTERGDYGEPNLGSDPDAAGELVADHLLGLVRAGHTVVDLRRLIDDGAMFEAVLRRAGDLHVEVGHDVNTSAVVSFDGLDDPERFLARLAKKHRLAQRGANLENEVGPVRFTPHDEQVDECLDFMDVQWRERFGDDGPRMLATPRRRAFTRESTHAMVDDGSGRVSTLRAGGQLVAVELIQTNGRFQASDVAAYDVSMSQFSLGHQSLFAILQQAWQEGAAEVDLRAGDFPYKYAWSNASRVSRSVVVARDDHRLGAMLMARRIIISMRMRELRRLD